MSDTLTVDKMTFTGSAWFPPQTITFKLSDGEYTIDFDPKVDTRDSLVEKLMNAIAADCVSYTVSLSGQTDDDTHPLDSVRHD